MNFFLDSGAFSVWNSGATIDIDKYIEFIQKHKDTITVYANLDVIGDPEATWENQRIMEEAGLTPLPIFHRGENMKYLYKCMEYDYFGLGGSTRDYLSKKIQFYDSVFNVICDKDGYPRNKIHGLGMTSFSMIRRYPLYSIDSTSWLICGAMGKIILPKTTNGKWDYKKEPLVVAISSKSSEKKKNQHFDAIPDFIKKQIERFVSEMRVKYPHILGEDGIDELKETGNARNKINMITFLEFMKTIPEYPTRFEFHNNKRKLWS
jgi:hypothetical protein